MFRERGQPDPVFTDTLELDMATVEPSLAGPKRPQDRVALSNAATAFLKDLAAGTMGVPGKKADLRVPVAGANYDLGDGDVVIAAITSCTNTSNPYVLVAAGLVAKKAHEKGLKAKPWVKTSLAPGSQVVTDYLDKAGLTAAPRCARLQPGRLWLHHLHRQFRPAAEPIGEAIENNELVGVSRALGQPQLRRPRACQCARELPRLAAAGGGLCARRHHPQGPHQGADRHGPATASRST